MNRWSAKDLCFSSSNVFSSWLGRKDETKSFDQFVFSVRFLFQLFWFVIKHIRAAFISLIFLPQFWVFFFCLHHVSCSISSRQASPVWLAWLKFARFGVAPWDVSHSLVSPPPVCLPPLSSLSRLCRGCALSDGWSAQADPDPARRDGEHVVLMLLKPD